VAFGTTPSNGTEYALWVASPAKKVRGALWGRTTRYASNAAITLAAGGQINLFRLNVGDVVLGGHAYWSALGANTAIWIGDAGDCDRYMTRASGVVASASQVGAAAANSTGDCGRFNALTGIGFVVTSTTQDVILTNSYTAATSALGAAAIKVVIDVATE
jgi:hypothetical protein